MRNDYQLRLSNLTDAQRTFLAERLAEIKGRHITSERLIAYVSMRENGNTKALRQHLESRLPDYMIPFDFVTLDALPKTPNGKIDRKQLPAWTSQEASPATSPTESMSPVAATLAGIWADVLNLPTVGSHDDFYRLGGDSILSIQVVSKAVQAGLKLSMKQFVEHRTIAELTAAIEADASNSRSKMIFQEPVKGVAPLTPIQHWFFQTNLANPHQWNQELLLTLPRDVDLADIDAAFAQLAQQHDALRTTFTRPQGHWVATVLETAPSTHITSVDNIEEAAKLHEGLDIEQGVLWKAALISDTQQLFLAAHHLMIDHVSWAQLGEDLTNLLKGNALPPATTSHKTWAEALFTSTHAGHWDAEIPFWTGMATEGRGLLPLDHACPVRDAVEASCQTYEFAFSESETKLLQERSEVTAYLLTALVHTLNEWAETNESWRVGIENHGRHLWREDLDVSRTLGWFTSYYQLSLPSNGLEPVIDTMERVPNHGLGFGALRYLKDEPSLKDTEESQILFNYLGNESPDKPAINTGRARPGDARRSHLLEINASIDHGCLKMKWLYSSLHHQEKTITRQAANYAKHLCALLAAPRSSQTFPLTPNQEALLWHHLQKPDNDSGLLELSFILEGQLEWDIFERAWIHVIARHAALRTSIHWQSTSSPHQMVHEEVAFALTKSEKFLSLSEAPVMNVSVQSLSDTRHRVTWQCHHILIDGWSASIVCQDVLRAYLSLLRNECPSLEPAPDFREYVKWWQAQSHEDAQHHWQHFLKDVPLRDGSPETPSPTTLEKSQLKPELHQALTKLAERESVTPAILFQVAWALVVSRYQNSQDVIIGNTASGRSVPLPNLQNAVGLYANTHPFRWQWDNDDTLTRLIKRAHREQLQAIPFEHTSLSQIYQWLDLPPSKVLFDSLMMFANYPHSQDVDSPIRLTDFQGDITSLCPVTIAITPGATITVKWFCQEDWMLRLPWMQRSFIQMLETLTKDPSQSIVSALDSLDPVPSITAAPQASRGRGDANTDDSLEQFLLGVWKQVFGHDAFDLASTFSELGGTSIMAAQLTSRLGEAFAKPIPLGLVFEAPSVRAMAKALRRQDGVMDWPIAVPIRTSGDRPPLFLVHGLGGGVFTYYEWVPLLPADIPIIGLQAPIDPLDDVEFIARTYLKHVRARQPHGPYHLGGFCFGSAVAFEMACQLEQAGEQVAYLCVIDGMLPTLQPNATSRFVAMAKNLGPRKMAKKALTKAVSLGKQWRRSFTTDEEGGIKQEIADVIDLSGYPPVYRKAAQIHFRALRDYQPSGRCHAPIHLIRSESEIAAADPAVGWDQVSESVQIDMIACEHHEIISTDHLIDVAKAIGRAYPKP